MGGRGGGGICMIHICMDSILYQYMCYMYVRVKMHSLLWDVMCHQTHTAKNHLCLREWHNIIATPEFGAVNNSENCSWHMYVKAIPLEEGVNSSHERWGFWEIDASVLHLCIHRLGAWHLHLGC